MDHKTHIIMILITMLFLLAVSGVSAYEEVYKKPMKDYKLPLFVGLCICTLYWTEALTRFVLGVK